MKPINPNRAVDYMLEHAAQYAQAKADRVYLEQYRKTKKALLFAQAPQGTVADRESFAYAHAEYGEVLDGLRVAVEREEELKFKLRAAELRVEIWRSQEASNRMVDKGTR